MNEELRNKLLSEFPDLFPKENPLYRRGSGVPFFIDCGDGWYKLIRDLCLSIRELLKENPIEDFMVVQVKEKFGGLRFYIGAGSDKIFKRINEAEEESYHICECCGITGKLRTDLGWIRTLCDKCYNHYKNVVKKK